MLTKTDLKAIGNLFDNKFDEKFKPLGKKINKIQKTLDHTIDFFDHEVIDLKARVKVLEDHPNLKLQQF